MAVQVITAQLSRRLSVFVAHTAIRCANGWLESCHVGNRRTASPATAETATALARLGKGWEGGGGDGTPGRAWSCSAQTCMV